MPWRLIIFILIFAVFLAFVTFNLENRCDISFGFIKVEAVPVFLTVFISFAMGLICALPLVMHIKKRHIEKPKNETMEKTAEPGSNEKIKHDSIQARKRFFSRRNGGSDG